MSTPLSFCDISARYGQMPAPQKSVEEQTGWNPNQLFKDYLMKLQRLREQEEEHAREDALMAMIDAMNASEEDKGRTEQTLANSLAKAGKAIVDQHVEVRPDGTKQVTFVDPSATLTVQALLSCLGDRFNFEEADQIQEDQEKAEEQRTEEERLEATETRGPSETSGPNPIGKEV